MNKVSNNKTSKGFLRIMFCSLFLFVFFVKMLISLAPLVIERFDKDSINAVIMQLEIEKEVKEDKLEKEKLGKELWDASKIAFLICCPVRFLTKISSSIGEESRHRSFYPSILTPPPDYAC